MLQGLLSYNLPNADSYIYCVHAKEEVKMITNPFCKPIKRHKLQVTRSHKCTINANDGLLKDWASKRIPM